MDEARMTGFTDIHTHVLPGVDDGAENMDQAREMVRMAWESGTRTMILTPHHRGAYLKNTPDQLRTAFDAFCRDMHEAFPDMKFYLGHEVHCHEGFPERLTNGSAMTLCDSDYVLLEFRSGSLRSQVKKDVMKMIRYGFIPIIAHVERYDAFRKNPSLVEEMIELGALIQINAGSVMGACGFGAKLFCGKLLKRGNVHFVASDAHDTVVRTPVMRECYLRIVKKYGAEYAAKVFWQNAQAVIENEMI